MSAARIFKSKFGKKNLKSLYFEKIQSAGAIGIDRVRPKNLIDTLDKELEIILKKVGNGSYKFTPYKQKLISKGAHSLPRVVSIPTARDRLVLRALCEFLRDAFPECLPQIPQVKIAALSSALESNDYKEFVKIDLKEFYPSIPHELITQRLQRKIRKPEILNIFASALSTPTVPESKGKKGSQPNKIGVPQGLSISNMLAEIAIGDIDATYTKRTDVWYARYVDDILVLTPSGQGKTVADELISQLKEKSFKPHDFGTESSKSKVGQLTERFSFLGYEVEDGELSIRPESIVRYESSLANIFTAYRHALSRAKNPKDKERAEKLCEWRLSLRVTGCIFKGRRLGWVFYFSQINNKTKLASIDATIGKLAKRFALDGKIKIKSVLKSFYESQRRDKSTHRYIINFDTLGTAAKRSILELLLGPTKVKGLSDKKIISLFDMKISEAAKELEEDISSVS